MPVPADAALLYVCITHIPLPLEFPPFVTPLYVGQAQGEGRLNLRDLAPEWEVHHPLLGGMAGTFAVKRLLRERPGARSVGLCQYRKFVSRERVSRVVAKSYTAMDVVSKAALPVERFAQAMSPGPEPFLVSRLLSVADEGGYLGQYGNAHRAQDLLRFSAEAVAQGVLESREAYAFLTEPDLIPGGIELGVFPVDFWLPNVTAVEAVVRACIERYPVAVDGYQARAWAFCAERLGSYLLLRHFRNGRRRSVDRLGRMAPSHWSRRFVGRLNLITEEGRADYAVGGT
jgi:hypothetical protein